MTAPVFSVATRASELALTQTAFVVAKLRNAFYDLHKERPDFEIRTIRTGGDIHRDDWVTHAASLDDDARARKWSLELEREVAAGTFDVAIHSGKDLPFRVFDGTTYVPVLERETAEDVFIAKDRGATLHDLAEGATIGTNSNRRRANLRSIRPDLAFAEYGGNITTRLLPGQMAAKGVDGVLMAAAGLKRLGLYDDSFMQLLPPAECLPAGNQGILAAQLRADGDARLAAAIAAMQHRETAIAWRAERSFLETFDAGCDTPVSVYADFTGTGDFAVLRAKIPQRGGRAALAFELSERFDDASEAARHDRAVALGRALAERVRASGARDAIAMEADFA